MKTVLLFRIVLSFLLTVSIFSHSESGFNAWTQYKMSLGTAPLRTKCLTSSGIMTVSDIVCQILMMKANRSSTKGNNHNNAELKDQSLDLTRTLHVAITGITWSGPIQHWWFGTLDRLVQIQDPIMRLVVKLFFDAVIFSPLTVAGYFIWRSLLEGSGLLGVREKLSTRFTSTVLGAWKFWPIVNIVNFSVVPLQFRVLYSNILSLIWTGYLTFVNSQKISGLQGESRHHDPNNS